MNKKKVKQNLEKERKKEISGGRMVSERKLYDAVSQGDVTALLELLNNDPYLVDGISFPCSRNLLHIAAMHGQTSLVDALLNLNPRLAWRLDSQKSSPLHIAAAEGHVEICQKLLPVGAPETCFWRDSHDMNPLHVAAMKGRVEVLVYFLQVSPFPAMERLRTGGTVLHLCVKHGQLAALNWESLCMQLMRMGRQYCIWL